jgi:hypothetical protein
MLEIRIFFLYHLYQVWLHHYPYYLVSICITIQHSKNERKFIENFVDKNYIPIWLVTAKVEWWYP